MVGLAFRYRLFVMYIRADDVTAEIPSIHVQSMFDLAQCKIPTPGIRREGYGHIRPSSHYPSCVQGLFKDIQGKETAETAIEKLV